MRVGERGILASLLLILLALLTSSLTGTFKGVAASEPPTWEWYLGLYLPFALFTLVGTYHFLDWAKKHRRQVILLVLLSFGVAILFGVSASSGPRPDVSSFTGARLTFTEQSEVAPFSAYSFPEIQQGLIKIQEALNDSPYYSFTANALVALMTLGVLGLWLIRGRMPRGTPMTEKPLSFGETARAPARTPREAIIRCYAFACQTLREGGIRIADSDTPTDICINVVARKPALGSHLRVLTSLFEEAKFSLHHVTEQEALDASAQWREISREIHKEAPE